MARTTTIEPELRDQIAATPLVISAAGGRVYPFMGVPQNAGWPHVTYHRVAGPRMGSLRGRTTGVAHPTFMIDVWARTYAEAKRLADAVRLHLEGEEWSGDRTWGGKNIQAVIVSDDHDLSESPMHGDEVTEYRVSMDATIWFDEVTP